MPIFFLNISDEILKLPQYLLPPGVKPRLDRPPHLADVFRAAMGHLHARDPLSRGGERHLYLTRKFASQKPRMPQPNRRLPNGDVSPNEFIPVRCPLKKTPANPALDKHLRLRVATQRMTGRPPRADVFGPQVKGVGKLSLNENRFDDDGFGIGGHRG